MNKSSKILIGIMIILIIAIVIMGCLYFNMKEIAKGHLEAYNYTAKIIKEEKIIERWNLDHDEKLEL